MNILKRHSQFRKIQNKMSEAWDL